MLLLQALLLVLATLLTILGSGRVLRRLGPRGPAGHVLRMGVRLCLVLGLCLVVGLSDLESRGALILAVGATYFAAVVGEGIAQFTRKGSSAWPSH